MARTPSVMLALGTPLPPFELQGTEGETVRAADLAGRPVLVMFLSNHCPFVKHVQAELTRLGRDFAASPLATVAIASNDPIQYPQDGPEAMRAEKAMAGYPFPYLFDATQEVARAFQAACTPDYFLFDAGHRLVYRGQLDAARPGNAHAPDGADLRAAIQAVLNGKAPASEQRPSLGCNIKWRAP